MKTSSKILAIAAIAVGFPVAAAASAGAAPLSASLDLRQAAQPSVQTVQFRRHGYWRGGGGFGPGFVAGAVIGGAIAATGPYGYYDGYGPGYGYGPPPGYVAVAPGGGGDAVAYCEQRFRSYDPRLGSYLGYDGARHPCP